MMNITTNTTFRITCEDLNDRLDALNNCVASLLVNSLAKVEFGYEGCTFWFKDDELIDSYINKIIMDSDEIYAPAKSLFMIYLQEKNVCLHIVDTDIDITLCNFGTHEINFDSPGTYIECEMIQREVGTQVEPNEVYDAFSLGLTSRNIDLLDIASDAIRSMFDEDVESSKPKDKKKSKKKRKIAKDSRRKNRKK